MSPFSPFFPWQIWHRRAKTSAPSLTVPCPGGSSFPSGPIMRSKLWISAGLRGVPPLGYTRGDDCASTPRGIATTIAGRRNLSEEDIGDAPIACDFPGLNGIEMDGQGKR